VSHLDSEDLRLSAPNVCPNRLGGKTKITKANRPKLTCPPDRFEVIYIDAVMPKLVLRAFPTGKQVWTVRYRDANGRSRRLTIGDAKEVDPATARDLARKELTNVASGLNPSVEKKAARRAATCLGLFNDYLRHAEDVQKPSTFEGTRRNLMKYGASLHSEAVANVDRRALRQLREKIAEAAGAVQANRTLATIRACWTWALKLGHVDGDNPAAYIPKFAEAPKTRVLTMDELRLIWACTSNGGAYHRIIRVAMLSGCRRSEIGGMMWGEIVGDLWTVPPERMKCNEPHEVPMTPLMLAQLPKRGAGEFVFGADSAFSGWSRAKERLDRDIARLRAKEAGIEIAENAALAPYYLPDWTPHDFRRAFSTTMNGHELAPPHIVEAVLAHAGAKGGVSGVYNLASFRAPKRFALEAWNDLLIKEGVVGGSDAAP
jgi:integrase